MPTAAASWVCPKMDNKSKKLKGAEGGLGDKVTALAKKGFHISLFSFNFIACSEP
jgi:hypothetical protein